MRLKSEILREICNRHDQLISDVLSRSRVTEVVRCRRAVAQELKAEGYRVCEIGRLLHRNHGTVHNLLKRRTR